MSVLLLTGPPAAGKHTVAEQIAKQRSHCAVIDVDTLRQMAAYPQVEFWEGEDGPIQHRLGIDNACALAHNFSASNYDVILIDVITDETLWLYKSKLPLLETWVVQLLPSEEEIATRLLSEPEYLSRGEVTWAYEQQASFTGYDDKLDTTKMSLEETTQWFLDRWCKIPV